MTARRGPSLFWTIAGMFLLTLVLGTLLQMLVADAVLRPLEAREARARAELAAASLAAEMAAAARFPGGAELDTLLAHHRANLASRPAWIVYRMSNDSLVTAPPDRAHRIARQLAGGEPTGGARDEPPGRPRTRLEVLARHAVVRGSNAQGEILVVRPVWPRSAADLLGSRTSFFFLPIGLIASVTAGVVMVRLLVRRLGALETLAARIAEGDLSARITDARGDEIGRLAERMNRMAERLAETREQLEATERQRRQLFADITHELATPLTSIRGFAETLLDPKVPVSEDERTLYVRGMLDEARRLDRLIRDLFELARLEAGASPLAKEPIDWVALCRNTVQRFERRFRDAGLHLVWRESPEEAWIEADGHRIEEVLENLLVNAVRYVPSGGTVTLALGRAPGRQDRFRLTIGDDGPGLSAEELPLAFERFYRGAGARGQVAGRGDGGSGLGLAIVREIVERHGGVVWAEPGEPHGLVIVVELPARA